jgi:uncharacterized integral membrane protein (TIGR00697 family)
MQMSRSVKLLLFLAAFFVSNALIAECIGGKLFSLENVFGFDVHPFELLGQDGLTITLTCGAILWPLEFILTDVINEYYGAKIVRYLTIITCVLIGYAFVAFSGAIALPPDQMFWLTSHQDKGVDNMQAAFTSIFGQSNWIIIGSLTAFFVSQMIDVTVFQWIRKRTGNSKVWLRATGSTFVSQLFDSFIVLFIAFYIGADWSIQRILVIALINYTYKASMALVLTPLIYLSRQIINSYLSHDKMASSIEM